MVKEGERSNGEGAKRDSTKKEELIVYPTKRLKRDSVCQNQLNGGKERGLFGRLCTGMELKRGEHRLNASSGGSAEENRRAENFQGS